MGLSTRNRGSYEIDKICWRSLHDLAFRERLVADVAGAIADIPLTDELREAFVAGDVGALYRRGAASFLLGYLPRYEIAGLTVAVYNLRMRAVHLEQTTNSER